MPKAQQGGVLAGPRRHAAAFDTRSAPRWPAAQAMGLPTSCRDTVLAWSRTPKASSWMTDYDCRGGSGDGPNAPDPFASRVSTPTTWTETVTEKHASGHDRLRPASGLMINSSTEPGLLDTKTDERCGTGEMSRSLSRLPVDPRAEDGLAAAAKRFTSPPSLRTSVSTCYASAVG